MTMTNITGPVEVDPADDPPAAPSGDTVLDPVTSLFRSIAADTTGVSISSATTPSPASRIEELTAELAAELVRLISAAEERLMAIDQQIDALTHTRRLIAEEVRTHRATRARLLGEKPDKKPTSTSSDAKTYPCDQCDRVFDTPQGRGRHRATIHPPTTGKAAPQPAAPQPVAARPSPNAIGRTVYRCGELAGDGTSCGSEFRNPADLSHHTLTAHRRPPTAGEKILVTPER